MNRYKTIDILESETGKRFRSNPVYPKVPESADDYYVIASVGDRYDMLAAQFYGDSRFWWVIASANNSQRASMIPTPGTQIRIPSDLNQAITLFENENKNR